VPGLQGFEVPACFFIRYGEGRRHALAAAGLREGGPFHAERWTSGMIVREYTVIRTAEPDDAGALKLLYDPAAPRCCLLDPRREPIFPNFDELREVMSKTEMGQPFLYAVEDKTGKIRGFCSLRAIGLDARHGEIVMMLHDDADFAGPVASEVLDFLARRAFEQFRLNKIMANALDSERAFVECLLRYGFVSSGTQREAVYTLGRWCGVETLMLHRPYIGP